MDKFKSIQFFSSHSVTLAEIYSEVAILISNKNISKETIELSFLNREQMGDLRIAKNILLPHFENENLESSMVLFIKLVSNSEQRDVNLKDINVIIAIAVKYGESKSIKNNIISFIRLLANEKYANYISQINSSKDLYELIRNMKEVKWK